MTRIEEQARTRDENAQYLTRPAARDSGHRPGQDVRRLHAQRLSPLHAPLQARGVCRPAEETSSWRPSAPRAFPASAAIRRPTGETFVRARSTLGGRLRVYSKQVLDDWAERCQLPENDKLCKEAVWLIQNMFLGPRSDMDQIADAVRKIRANAGDIAKAKAECAS